MKKFVAILLTLLMLVPVCTMTSCSDPLKELGNQLDATLATMGDTYYDAVYWMSYAGAYQSEDEQYADDNAKIEEWKTYIKEATGVVDAWLDLDEDQLKSYISEWEGKTAEIKEVVDKYYVEVETLPDYEGAEEE